MATNKHASIRYQALDRCFSNFAGKFFMDDLVEACNKAIFEFSGIRDGVKKRQIFDDISYMESEAGFNIELEKHREGRKVYYRYSDKNYSINKQPISVAEAEQLRNTLYMLNRFKGLPQFKWMEEVVARFNDSFKLRSQVSGVVSFEQNLFLKGIEHFTTLFEAITNKQSLLICYRPSFNDSVCYTIHPYHLKQYNNRWFLFGLNNDSGSIMNMAIDRICSINESSEVYTDNVSVDFNRYFEDIVGVTIPRSERVCRVVLEVDNDRYNYIESKPIHHTQIVLNQNESTTIIELHLILNYEFETLLFGFTDSINIIEPKSLKERIKMRAAKIIERNI